MFIGLIAGAVCYLALTLKTRFIFDDSLDVIAVHLVGGILGALLLGFFSDTKVNSLGFDGVLFGGGSKLLVKEGDAVLTTGCGLSETRDGGYGEYARLEARWAVHLPQGAEHGVAHLQFDPQALIERCLAQLREQAPGGFVGDLVACGRAEQQQRVFAGVGFYHAPQVLRGH